MKPTRRQMVCDEEIRLSNNGKENSVGRNYFKSSEILCPESTSTAMAIVEQPELRAYKLGKQKCSYNQVELVIKDISGGKVSELRVSEAIETIVGTEVEEQLRESCLKFHVRFVNNMRIQLYIYVVYSSPFGTTKPDKHTVQYHWMPVTRSKCRKGCTGSVIRGLQRFGRMPRRGAAAVDGEDTWKEPRHLYIAIDEASTHVCPRHETSKFRLLVAAYDDRHQLLGTTVSSSIRVLANNDAPLGAASFKLHCHLKGALKGPSPVRSGRLQLSDHQIPVQCRLPLQALPPNTSPSRSKTTSREETPKSDSSPSKGRELFMPQTTSASSNKQVDPARGREQLINPAFEGLQSDTGEEMALITSRNAVELGRVLETSSVKPTGSILSLRTLAKIVGSKRGVVDEILSVLQSVGVVHQHEKEKYRWLGSSSIMSTITKLSKEVNPHGRRKSMAQNAGSKNCLNASLIQARSFRKDETMDNSIGGLSTRLIRLFLIDVTTPVSWDQALTVFQDNHYDNNSEEYRLKERRLLEIFRILGTLHLVKRCAARRCSASSTFHWVGAEAVINYLNGLSGSSSQSEVHGNGPHYLRSSKHSTERRSRGFSCEFANGGYECDVAFPNAPIQHSRHLAEPTFFPKRLVNEPSRRSKRKLSDTTVEETEHFSASQLAGSPRLPASKCYSTRTSIPKRPRLIMSTTQVRDVSSVRLMGNNPEQSTYQSAFPERRGQEQISYDDVRDPVSQPLQEEISVREDGPTYQHRTDDVFDNRGYPFESRCSPAGCYLPTGIEDAAEETGNTRTSLPAMTFNSNFRGDLDMQLNTEGETFERSNGCVHEASEAQTTQFGVDNVFLSNPEYGSGPSVFQFPYKKRPHNWTSFLDAATARCFDDQQLPDVEYSHPGYFMGLTDRNELSCFRPLYYLQQLLTPQQVEQATAQNPDFLFHYVHYFRVIYHNLSAQATRKGAPVDQAVVRPVAEHGAVVMPSHLFARRREPESSAPDAPTLHQLLMPLSQGGLWLKKCPTDSNTCPDSDPASCHSPNSTHHVDKATTAEELSER